MSIIHVNQIKNQISRIFTGLIDMSDVIRAPDDMREGKFLSRGLAAYAVYFLAGATPEESAQAVTDSGGDNGLDGLFYDAPNKHLYLVQSKWIRDGVGEPDNGEIKKFVGGVRDIFNMEFDRFSARVRTKEALIVQALTDPSTRYYVVVAYTGSSTLAAPSKRDLADLAHDMNDTSEVVFVNQLNQSELHASLTAGIAGEPITIQVGLKYWGKKEGPHEAFYGQVSADQIASWWQKYRTRLFARNLRGMLGETDVNAEMRTTLEARPDDFWYFNNGVTVLAKSANRAMAGGGSNDFGQFHCEDVSVVNGAQTVGTIGKFSETGADLNNVFVPVRIIVRGDNVNFGEDVTRTNNRQNRIENRDFVALDPEQSRMKTELAIDGIDYQLMRSESVVRSDTSCDLVEATTALACASGTVRLPVQLKREVGKLWDDITKAPYKELFNASVPGLRMWRAVQIQRRIDKAIDSYVKRTARYNQYAIATHGNRLTSALVFRTLPVARLADPGLVIDDIASEETITAQGDRCLGAMAGQLQTLFPSNTMVPTLFKNQKKCELLAKATGALLGIAPLG
jgi:AIPR protein